MATPYQQQLRTLLWHRPHPDFSTCQPPSNNYCVRVGLYALYATQSVRVEVTLTRPESDIVHVVVTLVLVPVRDVHRPDDVDAFKGALKLQVNWG